MSQKILIASQNAHKIAEIAPLLEAAGFAVTDARFHELPEPVEDGGSFIANARIKAMAAMDATGMAVLADDSGLIVDALHDFPGVDTAPYSQKCGGYPQAVADLFERLGHNGTACHYVSTLVLAFPDGREIIAQGRVDGRLITEPRGDGRFGFDPWFELASGKTFAELTSDEKNQLSHRGAALRDMMKQLEDIT